MTERPILFSGDMVRAILDGRKTQTRRVMKPQPETDSEGRAVFIVPTPGIPACPYGYPGDRLWVRETWSSSTDFLLYRVDAVEDDSEEREGWWIDRDQKGNELFIPGKIKWRPSIHMPRWASRITLEITGVRVERVQDINAKDVEAEGIDVVSKLPHLLALNTKKSRENLDGLILTIARGLYSNLWDSIHGKGAWDRNDWVWAIEFKRMTEGRLL